MPEITDVPKSTPVIETAPLADIYESILKPPPDLRETPFVDIKTKISGLIEKLKRSYSGSSPATIDTISQLFAGPWLLESQTLTDRADTPQEKELSARIQHHLAHAVIFSSTENASENYRKNMYFLIKSLEKSAESTLGKNYRIASFLNGVKAEIATVKTLVNNNFRVLIPDYRKKSDFSKGKHSETMEWDVMDATDFIAISPTGEIILVDSKGRYLDSNINPEVNKEVIVQNERGIPWNRLTRSLKTTIQQLRTGKNNISQVSRARITVPTAASELGRLGTPESCRNYREALDMFGSLNANHQNSIIQALT